MRQRALWTRGLAWAFCALATQAVMAQVVPTMGNLGSQAAKNWAWNQVKAWRFSKRDARGHSLWENKTFFQLSYTEQTEQLLERLSWSSSERRAALLVLGDRPLDQWARAALRKAGDYWLRQIRDRCQSEACLASEYRNRIRELEAYYR